MLIPDRRHLTVVFAQKIWAWGVLHWDSYNIPEAYCTCESWSRVSSSRGSWYVGKAVGERGDCQVWEWWVKSGVSVLGGLFLGIQPGKMSVSCVELWKPSNAALLGNGFWDLPMKTVLCPYCISHCSRADTLGEKSQVPRKNVMQYKISILHLTILNLSVCETFNMYFYDHCETIQLLYVWWDRDMQQAQTCSDLLKFY